MNDRPPLHHRITFRLIGLFGLLVLAGTLAGAYVSIQMARSEFFRVLERQFDSTSTLAENSLDIVGQMARAWAFHFAEEADLPMRMKQGHALISQDVERMRQSAQCDTLIVLDKQGHIVHHSAFDEKGGESLMAWQIVRRAVNESRPSYAIIEESGNFIVYGSGIALRERQAYVVLVGFRISDQFVKKLLQDSHIGMTFVRRTAVMASSFNTAEHKLIDSPVPFLDYQTLLNNPHLTTDVAVNGEDYYAAVRRLRLLDPAMDGSLLLTYPVANLMAIVSRLQYQYLFLYMAGMLLFSLAAWRISTRTMRPLRRLAERMARLRRGDASPVAIEQHDEVGIIAASVNDLLSELESRKEKIERHAEELEVTVAQRTQELREANEALTRLATHDTLTGLPNRKRFNDRLHQAVALAHRAQANMALMFVDLDRFKWVNDTYGHAVGDELLKEASRRIQSCLREGDTVARLGGDEFTVILAQAGSHADIEIVATRLLHELTSPFNLTGAAGTQISGSIGIAVYPEHGESAAELLLHADHAMYNAKRAGRATYRFWDASMGIAAGSNR